MDSNGEVEVPEAEEDEEEMPEEMPMEGEEGNEDKTKGEVPTRNKANIRKVTRDSNSLNRH